MVEIAAAVIGRTVREIADTMGMVGGVTAGAAVMADMAATDITADKTCAFFLLKMIPICSAYSRRR